MAFSFGADTAVSLCVVKTGGFMVVVVEDVTVRWATGLRFAGLGGTKKGESKGSTSCEEESAPSSREGEIRGTTGASSSSGVGDAVGCLTGNSGDGLRGRSC